MYSIDDYDFHLPPHLIASTPRERRDESRLLCLDRHSGRVTHGIFRDIAGYLRDGDLLVMNNTRVVPARIFGFKESGGQAEVLILDYPGGMARLSETGHFECECLVRSSKRPKPGSVIRFCDGFQAQVLGFDDGITLLRFHTDGDFETALSENGVMPLPPYIKRAMNDPLGAMDQQTYQTVYAREKGAVAAPTAGLHFTEDLLETLRAKGVETTALTLHVGYGTFVPVRVKDIRDHAIHHERFHIPDATAHAINTARAEKRRIIAVGTTSVRTLEYAAARTGSVTPGHGTCDLFIYPGYDFRIVDAMITNFHIPQSTLLMLVSAFAGMDHVKEAYRMAIENEYRFYSYGDSMLIV